ncbi:MAG: flagellar hook assembly protein FlgD [Gammaproteobacteria bacterium]|nr:flagellar hook assembly protein FlgD [Gammaproteobacteria bacterium]
MSSIDNVSSIYDSLGLSQQEKPKGENDKLGQDEFLKLMISQMNNQDPMKPMENGEFLTQIAQFSQVSGIKDLQDSFSEVANSLSSNQALQASSLIGRTVLAPGSTGLLPSDGQLQGTIELHASTPSLKLGIYDTNGQLIKQVELGTQAEGQFPFSWDGTRNDGTLAPPGRYVIKAEALIGGSTEAVDTQVAAVVESVSLGQVGQSLSLNLSGLGSLDLSDVTQVF